MKALKKSRKIFVFFLIFLSVFISWIIYENKNIQVNELTIKSENLPKDFSGYKIAHISEDHSKAYVFKWSLISSVCALGFNVIADPIFGYFYKNYFLGVPSPAAKIMSTWAGGVTAINAVAGTIVVVVVYNALRPTLKKAGLFV